MKVEENVEDNSDVRAEEEKVETKKEETPFFSQALKQALEEPKKEEPSIENSEKEEPESPKQVQQGVFSNVVLPDSDKENK